MCNILYRTFYFDEYYKKQCKRIFISNFKCNMFSIIAVNTHIGSIKMRSKYDNYDEIIALIVQSTIYCNHLSQTFFLFLVIHKAKFLLKENIR